MVAAVFTWFVLPSTSAIVVVVVVALFLSLVGGRARFSLNPSESAPEALSLIGAIPGLQLPLLLLVDIVVSNPGIFQGSEVEKTLV